MINYQVLRLIFQNINFGIADTTLLRNLLSRISSIE